MAFTVFANTSRVCLFFTWNTVKCSVCCHFDHASPSAADYLNLATDFADEWDVHMKPNQSSDLALGDCIAYDLNAADSPSYTYTGVNGNAGGSAIDSTPNNTAGVISHRTVDRGRSARGRTYVPGFTENNIVNGKFDATTVTALLADWASIVAGVAVNGWTLVVAQRFDDGIQLATGVTRVVTTEIMSESPGTQRRRQR